ncbi:MAG: WecB/TagA/CpsF family glycosyltransferase [Gammaproteobacteria bacterium]
MSSFNLFNYQICNNGLKENVEYAWSLIMKDQFGSYVACANPHSLVVAKNDSHFRSALKNADILLPDGTGIVLAARILNEPLSERVAGTEFFLKLSEKANESGTIRYFFLGSSDMVLSKLVERFTKEYPNIEVCGTYSPPFKDEFSEDDNKKMISAINKAQPDVLWVGMTAPKQEKWIYNHRNKLNVRLCGAIGAVFDFYAGTRKRAPQWICNLGLEWLPRLLRDPKRLWRRNFISTPLFLVMLAKEKLNSRPSIESSD